MTHTSSSSYVPTYADEISLTRHFIRVLEQRLAGRDRTRAVNTLPLDWCRLGVLGPCSGDVELLDQNDSPTDETESPSQSPSRTPLESPAPSAQTSQPSDAGAQSESTADAPDRGDRREGPRRPPSALGFEILVEPDEEGAFEIVVKSSFCVFSKHLPSYQEQGELAEGSPLAEVAQRWPIEIPPILFAVSSGSAEPVVMNDDGVVNQMLEEVRSQIRARPDVARVMTSNRPRVRADEMADQDAYGAWLQAEISGLEIEAPPLAGSIEVRVWPRGDGRLRVGCYLRNNTRGDELGYLNAFRHFGDAHLSVIVERGELCPIEILPVPQDYQYDRRVWAVGHNASVRVADDHKSLRTETLAQYEQPRVVTQDDPKPTFRALADDPFTTLDLIRHAMEIYADDWSTGIIDANALCLDSKHLAECASDLEGFRDEINRFACGIAALQVDPRLCEAFKSMNLVFGRLAKGYDSWRLFQIVFIVTQLPALAIAEGAKGGEWPTGEPRSWDDILDWGDVLWFRTGGGKTEAYLGLTCCAILYDRLRGKAFGVTSWLRFPLRMLSVQQLQRAMRVVWEAEKERKRLLGDKAGDSDPFRLGYFVGKSTTPNNLSENFHELYDTPEKTQSLRVVPDCPECGGKGTVFVYADARHRRFKHVCNDCNTELPLDISDDEVYRYLPCLLIGTVDKMASVGLQIKFGMLWGAAQWRCPQHGYGFGRYCIAFGCQVAHKDRVRVSPYDPAPSFHIQDELHLLQEELGAFSGHYETLIRYCEEIKNQRPSKVVAATATIEGFDHQIRHLYGVSGARRFPGRGYDRLKSFYARPDLDPSGTTKTARLFVAFRITSMHSTEASALCTEILQSEVNRLMLNPSEALAFLHDALTDVDVGLLLHYYTTSLNYVASLQGGSRVTQALEEAASRTRVRAPRDLNVEYHNSRSTGAEVADLVHRVENPNNWEDESFLDALVATNMISHGVDLERINLMTMDGVPEETAQYIQASSRSGRKHVGIVIVVLPSYSLRASSIYHRFLEYHDHLERMVSPVPINRFAKYAAKRTMPGILAGLIFGRHFVETGDENLKKRPNCSALLRNLGSAAVLEEIRRAYALDLGVYNESLELGLSELLQEAYVPLEMSVHNSTDGFVFQALKPKPMTSLRDVELGVPFNPDEDHRVLMWLRAAKE